uniref:Uncharacterized protein n=1 Tax=Lepeophtheirus salmonis TaxID=72036 RepID=A0A0K2V951_LEPSM
MVLAIPISSSLNRRRRICKLLNDLYAHQVFFILYKFEKFPENWMA